MSTPGSGGGPRPKHLKHAVDRAVALWAAPWALPTGVAIAAAIKLEDVVTGEGWGGEVFYRERRYSADRPFDLLKFRVIRRSVLEERRRQGRTTIKEVEHDPQAVTRVGRFLVDYYLDELPQLLHVLSGRMSLVGPRPVWPHDRQRRAHFAPYRIKAGLAGTFQLAKGTGDIFELDKVYLERYAQLGQVALLRYDLSILRQTVRKMTRGEGL